MWRAFWREETNRIGIWYSELDDPHCVGYHSRSICQPLWSEKSLLIYSKRAMMHFRWRASSCTLIVICPVDCRKWIWPSSTIAQTLIWSDSLKLNSCNWIGSKYTNSRLSIARDSVLSLFETVVSEHVVSLSFNRFRTGNERIVFGVSQQLRSYL